MALVTVTLRPATAADADKMLAWQSHSDTRRYFRNPEIPTKEEHARWVNARFDDPDCLLKIIELEGLPVGVLRLDRLVREDEAYLISILVAPDHRGVGVGKAALVAARRLLPNAAFEAEVLPENAASHALFHAAGFKFVDGRYRAGT